MGKRSEFISDLISGGRKFSGGSFTSCHARDQGLRRFGEWLCAAFLSRDSDTRSSRSATVSSACRRARSPALARASARVSFPRDPSAPNLPRLI